MTQHDTSLLIELDFLIVHDFNKQIANILVAQEFLIVVADTQVLHAIQTLENLNRLHCGIPTDIAQNPHIIVDANNRIPFFKLSYARQFL